MTYLLRSWTNPDTNCDREISQSIYPEYREEPGHPAWFAAQQLGAPRDYAARYVVVGTAGDERVGYATLWELRPRRFRFDLAVRPNWQGQGIGTQLLAIVVREAERLGASGLQARVRDDKHDSVGFIRRRGFCEVQRMGAYRLEFSRADGPEFAEAFNHLRDRDIEVTNLAAVRVTDPHYVEQFLNLYSAARYGWPDPDPETETSGIQIYQMKRWLDETKLPEAFFIARHQGRYVAFTSLFGLGTAVHPEYRGKGIARLLKAGSIVDAQRRGFHGQTTGTASPAMRSVLERIGYTRMWSEIRLIRNLAL